MTRTRLSFRLILFLLLVAGAAFSFWYVIVRESVGNVIEVLPLDSEAGILVRESRQGDLIMKVNTKGEVVWRQDLESDFHGVWLVEDKVVVQTLEEGSSNYLFKKYDPESGEQLAYPIQLGYDEVDKIPVLEWDSISSGLPSEMQSLSIEGRNFLYHPQRQILALFRHSKLKKAVQIERMESPDPIHFSHGNIWIYGNGFWGILDAGTLQRIYMTSKDPKVEEITAEFEKEFGALGQIFKVKE